MIPVEQQPDQDRSNPRRPHAYRELIAGMLRTGVLGYGGGPSIVPLIRHEAVHHYHWVTEDEFAEALAVANALPGPIAPQLAAYLGYRQRGAAGAATAVLAHILPTCLAMVALYSALHFVSSSHVISGMIAAVTPVICVMLATMTYEFAKKGYKGLGLAAGILFGGIAFLLLETAAVPPAFVILLFIAYGSRHFHLAERLRSRFSRRDPSAGKGE